MNKQVKIIIGIVVIAGSSYMIYRHVKQIKPKVDVISIDWKNNIATLKVDGIQHQLTEPVAIMAKNGYSVEFGSSYRTDINKIGPTRIDIVKGGSVYDTIAFMQQ